MYVEPVQLLGWDGAHNIASWGVDIGCVYIDGCRLVWSLHSNVDGVFAWGCDIQSGCMSIWFMRVWSLMILTMAELKMPLEVCHVPCC